VYALYNFYPEVDTVIFLGDMNGEIVHSGNATPCLRDIMFTHFLDHYGLISHVHLPDCNGPKYDHGQNAESHWYAISRH